MMPAEEENVKREGFPPAKSEGMFEKDDDSMWLSAAVAAVRQFIDMEEGDVLDRSGKDMEDNISERSSTAPEYFIVSRGGEKVDAHPGLLFVRQELAESYRMLFRMLGIRTRSAKAEECFRRDVYGHGEPSGGRLEPKQVGPKCDGSRKKRLGASLGSRKDRGHRGPHRIIPDAKENVLSHRGEDRQLKSIETAPPSPESSDSVDRASVTSAAVVTVASPSDGLNKVIQDFKAKLAKERRRYSEHGPTFVAEARDFEAFLAEMEREFCSGAQEESPMKVIRDRGIIRTIHGGWENLMAMSLRTETFPL